MNNDADAIADGSVAIGLGVYLAVVFYQGNLTPLLQQLKGEVGYLEFLVAAFVIYKLLEIKMTQPIIGLFIVGAVLVAVMNVARNSDTSAIAQFGAGQIGLFQLIGKLAGAT